MNEGFLALAAFGAALGGFAALSLAMVRHFQDCFGRYRVPGHWLPWFRVGGVLGLTASLAVCLTLQGTGQGWVLWFGVLTVASFFLMGIVSYAPRWLLATCLLGFSIATLVLLSLS